MLPKPDFSALDAAKCTDANECKINKIVKQSSQVFRCIPCKQVFSNASDLITHEEEHIPCGFAGCDFLANYKVLLDHQTSVHMNLKRKGAPALENDVDIEKWRAERRKRFPKVVNSQKELPQSDQIEPVNSNESRDKSTGVQPTGEDHLPHAVGAQDAKECVNDSSNCKDDEICCTRKRGPISTYGPREGEGSNKFSKKKRRNQRKKHRDHNQHGEKDERDDGRCQSNSSCEARKSGGNFSSTFNTKGTSASGFMRRPTLFEKLMQSSALQCKSKEGDNE